MTSPTNGNETKSIMDLTVVSQPKSLTLCYLNLDRYTLPLILSHDNYKLRRLRCHCGEYVLIVIRLAEVIDEFYDKIDFLERNLSRIVLEGVGLPGFNWRSTDDRAHLFYDMLGIPPIKNKGRITTDRAAREKMEKYTIAKPIITHMNLIADIAEKIKKLKTKVDPDGRIRTTYNIAGTDTGRFSSSFSVYGTGGNLQNVEESLRSIFIADPGMKFAKCDAKSGESFVVGAIEWNLFNDPAYLEACESGDPHTAVARICWPELGWTGNLKQDKAYRRAALLSTLFLPIHV